MLSYYDEWLEEPRLLVPGVQPIGNVQVDWSNPLTKGLKRCFIYNRNGWFVDAVSGVQWTPRYSAFIQHKNRYGCGVTSYNQSGSSLGAVPLSRDSVDRHTFVTIGYANNITAFTNSCYLFPRGGGFAEYINYWNTGTSLRVQCESTSLESGTFFYSGDLVGVAVSRDQVGDELECVFCRNCSQTKIVGPSARSVPVTYDGNEIYHLAMYDANAQPLMCLMEIARILSVQEKLEIVRNPYQVVIPI